MYVEEKIVDSDGQIRIALRWVPNIQRINKDDQKKEDRGIIVVDLTIDATENIIFDLN